MAATAATVRRMDDGSRELDETIAGCAAAHQRLLADLDGLTDDEARSPSSLPGWSIGHVLTHLARNADSFVRIIEGAGRREVLDQYEGGLASRAADIEAGAQRAAGALVDDVRRSIWRLESAWASAPADAWEGAGRVASGDLVRCTDLPFRRWREVEVHHADLGLPAFTCDEWSAGYVRRELRIQTMVLKSRLPMGVGADLPAAALALTPNRRVAWLLGRLRDESLPVIPPF